MIVIDANIMASALMGTSLPVLADVAAKVAIGAPRAQFTETYNVLTRLGHRDADAKMALLFDIVQEIDEERFAPLEERARERLHPRGQSDWPVLAAAMALDAAIWSRDPDLFGTGVAIWSTRNVRFVEAEAA